MFRPLPLIVLASSLLSALPALSAESSSTRVKMVTSAGEIVLELDRELAPATVANFEAYVADGFYVGTVFHRVIQGFMIQGGGFDAEFKRKPTREAITNEADNGLRNLRGTIAMARTSAPHSATSQFFINLVDNDFLDHRSKSGSGWGYTVFGKVTDGMDVVERIARLPTAAGGPFDKDVPQQPVAIVLMSVESPE